MDFRTVNRPIILAFQISGFFSVTVKNNGYSFSWFSIETIYAIFIHLVMGAVAFFATLNKIKLLYHGYDIGLESFFTLVVTWPNFLLPITALFTTKSVATYLNEWKSVEEEFLTLTGKALRFPELKLVSRILPCCSVGFTFVIFSIAVALGRHSILQAAANGWPILVFNIIATMWQIQTKLITSTFRELRCNFATTLWSTRQINTLALGRYKVFYLKIVSLTESFVKSMNLVTILLCLSLYIDMTIASYIIIVSLTTKEITAALLYKLFFPFTYCISILQIICDAGGTIAAAGGSQFSENICALTPQFTSASRAELLRLMDTVHLQAPTPTLAGCLNLGRGLTVTALGIMFGYLVTLFQFRTNLE